MSRVFRFWIVEHLDEIEHIASRLFSPAIASSPDAFALEQVEEVYSHGGVINSQHVCSLSAPTDDISGTMPIHTGELWTLIGTDRHLVLRLTPPHRWQQSLENDNQSNV